MSVVSRAIVVCVAIGGLLLMWLPPAVGAGSSYSYTQIDVSAAKITCDDTVINSINNRDVMLGTEYCTASRAFVDRDGHDTIFRLPGGSHLDTEPSGISNNGKYIVVDGQHNYTGRSTAYLRTNGKFHKLTDPKAGRAGTEAEAVNNMKEIVGLYFTGKGQTHYHGFIDRGGKFRTFHLRVKAAVNVAIIDVNDNGELAGYYQDKHHRYHGFIVDGTRTHIINAPGAGRGSDLGTSVLSIADNGTYCGNVYLRHGKATKNTLHGYIHRDGTYQTVVVPHSFGGHNTSASSCNDSGEVAGNYAYNLGGPDWEDISYSATPA